MYAREHRVLLRHYLNQGSGAEQDGHALTLRVSPRGLVYPLNVESVPKSARRPGANSHPADSMTQSGRECLI